MIITERPQPASELINATVTVWLTAAQKEQLRADAAAAALNMSAHVRALIVADQEAEGEA